VYQHSLRTFVASLCLAVIALTTGPAHAGIATGTLSLSVRIVDSCDVHTSLPGDSYASPTSAVQATHSRSTCNAGTPAPRVTTSVVGAPAVVMPGAAWGKRPVTNKGRATVKIVTVYF